MFTEPPEVERPKVLAEKQSRFSSYVYLLHIEILIDNVFHILNIFKTCDFSAPRIFVSPWKLGIWIYFLHIWLEG